MGLLKKIMKSIYQPVINNMKGKVGEAKVNRKLNPLIFGKVEHRLINNLIIVDNNGKSHQIDHVEIRQNGIFCIETKNYMGWIFGDENQEKWTQTLHNGEKHQFYNPLKQNKSHIYHLSIALGKRYRINSIVVMVNNNADKINSSNVINLNYLQKYLDSYYDGTHYSLEEMEQIYNEILSLNKQITNKEHVDNIKKTQKDIQNGICPRCGGNLVERNGRYGKFYGCSNYPNCKFILKNK